MKTQTCSFCGTDTRDADLACLVVSTVSNAGICETCISEAVMAVTKAHVALHQSRSRTVPLLGEVS